MKVKVEACWGGRDVYHRLTLPERYRCPRLTIHSESWDRQAAKEAKDLILIELNWSVSRQSIRFDVH